MATKKQKENDNNLDIKKKLDLANKEIKTLKSKNNELLKLETTIRSLKKTLESGDKKFEMLEVQYKKTLNTQDKKSKQEYDFLRKEYDNIKKISLKDIKEKDKLKSGIEKITIEKELLKNELNDSSKIKKELLKTNETISNLKQALSDSEVEREKNSSKLKELLVKNEKRSENQKKINAKELKQIEFESKKLEKKQKALRKERDDIIELRREVGKSAKSIASNISNSQSLDMMKEEFNKGMDSSTISNDKKDEDINFTLEEKVNKIVEEKLSQALKDKLESSLEKTIKESVKDNLDKTVETAINKRIQESDIDDNFNESKLNKPETTLKPASELPVMRMKLLGDYDEYEHRLIITYSFDNMPENLYYSKYKKILSNAARITLLGNLQEGLEMFNLVKDQNLPQEYKDMIDKNIQDITYYVRGLHRVRMEQ